VEAGNVTVARYRRRPVEVDAIQFTGTNGAEVAEWCGGRVVLGSGQPDAVLIQIGWTRVSAKIGDYVVRELLPRGEVRHFPMRGEIFEWVYVAAEEVR
jgi:hypothetical protein